MNARVPIADIDPVLLAGVEEIARAEGRTVASVIDEALAAVIGQHRQARHDAAMAKAEDIIGRYRETLRILAQ